MAAFKTSFPVRYYETDQMGVVHHCTGTGLSVLQLINTFEQATGVKVKYKIVGRRAGDIEKVWADTSLANKELGWKAVVPLNETLLNAWKWQQRLVNKG